MIRSRMLLLDLLYRHEVRRRLYLGTAFRAVDQVVDVAQYSTYGVGQIGHGQLALVGLRDLRRLAVGNRPDDFQV